MRCMGLLILWILTGGGAALPAGQTAERVLTAEDLYAGLEATRILPKAGALVLDTRNWPEDGGLGIVTTDVLDLGGQGVLSPAATVSDLRIDLTAKAGPPASVFAEVRTGLTFFQAAGTWTEWQAASGIIQPKGRYAQVRVRLTTGDRAIVPSVTAVRLTWNVEPVAFRSPLALLDHSVQNIVNSALPFDYERPDQPDLVWMRNTFQLDSMIAGKRSEFEKLKALLDWTAMRKNKRPGPRNSDGSYPWNIRQVLTEENGGAVHGHCMSYCETFIAAAVSLGWQARHFAIQGFRDTSHEVPEVWVNELGKWVFMDPSLGAYYADRKTGAPLSLLEMHDIYVNFVLKSGEALQRGEDVNLARVQSLRGRHPVKCVANGYAYGERQNWDWEYDHGYMTAGWMQLTPRNDWQSRPEPWCGEFSNSPDGYCGFPVYVDERTPVVESTTSLWYTRARDLWWTLNQASFRLTQTEDEALSVECGNSQPFFRRYLARIDEGEWKEVERQFTWRLKDGMNRLEVICEDEFGSKGIASIAVVRKGEAQRAAASGAAGTEAYTKPGMPYRAPAWRPAPTGRQ